MKVECLSLGKFPVPYIHAGGDGLICQVIVRGNRSELMCVFISYSEGGFFGARSWCVSNAKEGNLTNGEPLGEYVSDSIIRNCEELNHSEWLYLRKDNSNYFKRIHDA